MSELHVVFGAGPLREDSPINPHTQKGKVRAAMAQEILDAHASGKIRAAIGRASDFFGPYDTSLTNYAIRPAVQGKPVNLLGRADQPHSFTYVKDFMMYEWLHPFVIDSSKAAKAFGLQATPLATAVQETIAWRRML